MNSRVYAAVRRKPRLVDVRCVQGPQPSDSRNLGDQRGTIDIIDDKGGCVTITHDNILVAVKNSAVRTYERLQKRLEREFRYFNVVLKSWNVLNDSSAIGEKRMRQGADDIQDSSVPTMQLRAKTLVHCGIEFEWPSAWSTGRI
jgi:hypothetical protein